MQPAPRNLLSTAPRCLHTHQTTLFFWNQRRIVSGTSKPSRDHLKIPEISTQLFYIPENWYQAGRHHIFRTSAHCIRHSDNFARPPIAHLEPTHLPAQLPKCTGLWPTHLTPPHLSSPALKAPHLCLPALKTRPFARPMHDLSPNHGPP